MSWSNFFLILEKKAYFCAVPYTFHQTIQPYKMQNLTYEQVLSLFAETRDQITRLSAETDKQIKTLSAETDKQIAETGKQIKALAKQVGGITDAQGHFAEHQVRPKLLEIFKSWGVDLSESHFDVEVEREGKHYVQIDLLLVNTIYSVVVEVKHKLRENDIDEHLERLAKLQAHPSRAIKGTMMYGAVAGMIVSREAAQYAIKKGLFVIVPKGDNVEIANTKDFKPAAWPIAMPQ